MNRHLVKVELAHTLCASGSPMNKSQLARVLGIARSSLYIQFRRPKPDKSQVVKSTEFANTRAGFELLHSRLTQLAVATSHVLIGLEATSRYGEHLYHFLDDHGYQLCLLHPRQTHQFARQRGLRAKTDRLDTMTIARVLLSRVGNGKGRPSSPNGAAGGCVLPSPD